jgi:hypothetical protein
LLVVESWKIKFSKCSFAQNQIAYLGHLFSSQGVAFPNFDRPFIIETDACDVGIGAVLMQDGHPLAFLSKALGPKFRGLSTYEKEYMAILLAVQQWRSYLQQGSSLYILIIKVYLSSMSRGSTQHGSTRCSQSFLGCSIELSTRRVWKIELLMLSPADLILSYPCNLFHL